jgi:hypothetical protein
MLILIYTSIACSHEKCVKTFVTNDSTSSIVVVVVVVVPSHLLLHLLRVNLAVASALIPPPISLPPLSSSIANQLSAIISSINFQFSSSLFFSFRPNLGIAIFNRPSSALFQNSKLSHS